MIKGILVSSILATTLIFSGCDSDSEGVDRVTTQSMLDNGNYTGVISKLESSSSLTSEQSMQLGSAYMGAAGLTLLDLTLMLNPDDSTTNPQPSPSLVGTYADGGSNDDYREFLKKLRENAAANPKVLEYLEKAIAAFNKVLDKSDENTNAKLLAALSRAAKASTSITYLGNVEDLIANGPDDEMFVSACAMVYVYANSKFSEADNCVDVALASDNNTSDRFKEITVTVTGDSGNYTARRLTSLDGTDLILSDGYVDGDGNRTTDPAGGLNSANPVGDENLTIKSVILDDINSGFDALIDIAPDDVKGDITDFKNELDADKDGTITSDELADYLTKQ